MLSRDRLSLGFNDTFPEMIEKLREELKELEEVPGSADPSYELADCLLVLARMFNLLNIDPEKAVEEKMRILRRRYALARTLRESFPEKTHEQLYQMAKGILRNKKLNCLFRHSPAILALPAFMMKALTSLFIPVPRRETRITALYTLLSN